MAPKSDRIGFGSAHLYWQIGTIMNEWTRSPESIGHTHTYINSAISSSGFSVTDYNCTSNIMSSTLNCTIKKQHLYNVTLWFFTVFHPILWLRNVAWNIISHGRYCSRDLTILGRQRDDDGQNKLLQINGSKDNSWYIINRMNLIQS
jgi:hypothetical protein